MAIRKQEFYLARRDECAEDMDFADGAGFTCFETVDGLNEEIIDQGWVVDGQRLQCRRCREEELEQELEHLQTL